MKYKCILLALLALLSGVGETVPTPPVMPSQQVDYQARYEQERIQGTVSELSHRPFEELPQELQDSLTWDGKTETVEGYSFLLRTYTAPGITVVTTQAPNEVLDDWLELQLSLPQEGREIQGTDEEVRGEIEGERGREWLHSVTLTDGRYATVPGLRVGDTVERARTLGYPLTDEQLAYGEATFGVPMETYCTVTVDDGVVTQLHLSFGLGRYVGRYWDI